MVAPLLVFGLVVYGRAVDLHLAGREIALEILHIGGGVPQTPFLEREEAEAFGTAGEVGQGKLGDLGVDSDGDKEEGARLQSLLAACDDGVIQAVAAFVEIERGLAGLPAGAPDGVAIFYIEITASGIHRHPVVAVAGETPEFGVTIEGVASCGVGNQREECLVSEVVDPRPGGGRVSNHILTGLVVEMAVFHIVKGLRVNSLRKFTNFPQPGGGMSRLVKHSQK